MKVRGKEMMKYLLIAIYLVLTVSGLILMKKGGNAGTINIKAGELNFGISLISALGFVCYIFSFLLYTRIVMMFENLNYITPICTGLAQIMIFIASYLFLKESIGATTVAGMLMIIAGIVVMNIKR